MVDLNVVSTQLRLAMDWKITPQQARFYQGDALASDMSCMDLC